MSEASPAGARSSVVETETYSPDSGFLSAEPPSSLQIRAEVLSEDIFQCLETYLVEMTRAGCYWHLLGLARDAAQHSLLHRTKAYPAPVTITRGRDTCFRGNASIPG